MRYDRLEFFEQEMLPLFALFSGEPPFGIPHVNPTVETWGAGDYTKVFEA